MAGRSRFSAEFRAGVVGVIAKHGATAGADWAGVNYSTAWTWARDAGLSLPRHGNSAEAKDRALARRGCSCGMCAEAFAGEAAPAGVRPRRVVVEVAWQDFANCLGCDPELFFPERGASTREAKEVCRGCVVREDCLEYALANFERFGIWGGMSERERRRIRRQRSAAAEQRPHGTRSCYASGCREPECVEANNAYDRDDRRGL